MRDLLFICSIRRENKTLSIEDCSFFHPSCFCNKITILNLHMGYEVSIQLQHLTEKNMFIIAPISVENGNKAGEMLCNWQVTTNVCALSASQSDALFVCLVRFQNTEVATCTAKMLSLRLHNKTSIITGERQDGYFYIQSVHQTGKACVVWLGNMKLYKQEKLAKSKTITLICFPLFKICGRQKISFAAMQCHDIAVLSMIEWLSVNI